MPGGVEGGSLVQSGSVLTIAPRTSASVSPSNALEPVSIS